MPETKQPETFEEAMAELETIVQDLEASKMPLSDLVGNYERGTRLLKFCRGEIQVARQRVEKITLVEDGEAVELAELSQDQAAADSAGDAAPEKPKKRRASKRSDSENDDDVRLF